MGEVSMVIIQVFLHPVFSRFSRKRGGGGRLLGEDYAVLMVVNEITN
jgi:hypothetical protein